MVIEEYQVKLLVNLNKTFVRKSSHFRNKPGIETMKYCFGILGISGIIKEYW